MKLQIEYKTSNYEDTTLYNIVSNGEVIGYVVDYDDELTDNYGGAYAILKGKFRGHNTPVIKPVSMKFCNICYLN